MKTISKQITAYIISILFVMIVFLVLFEISCKNKEFILTEFNEACSFEYPSTYELQEVDRTPDLGAVVVGLKFSKTENLIASFTIEIIKPNEQFRNASSLLEYHLNVAKQEDLSGEFKLSEKSPILVGGTQGEKIIYYYIRRQSSLNVNNTRGIPDIAYEAFLERNGYIWGIGVHSIVEDSDQAKADFNHIISSFKFLD